MASGHILFTGVPEVMPSGPPGARQTIQVSADMFGGQMAAATDKLGSAVQHATEVGLTALTARNDLQNEIHAAEANTWLADRITEKYETFAALRGKAAQDALPQFKTDLDDLYREHIGSAGNLQTQAMLAKNGRYLTSRYYQYGAMHASREVRTWADQTAQRRAATFGAQAANAADSGDMAGMQTALNTSDDEVRKLAEQHGFDAEATQAAVLKNRGHNLRVIIEQAGNSDPVAAQTLYQRHKDGMDPDSQLHVRNFLRGKLTGVVAKGRVDELLGPEAGATSQRKFESVLQGRESSYSPTKVNQFGYAGLYQFGAPRLADMGVYTAGAGEDLKTWKDTPRDAPGKWSGTFNVPGFPQVRTVQDFLASPAAQRAAYGLHQERMDREIEQNGFDRYIGETVGGVPITREGLYAMLHIGGAQGARRALESGGKDSRRDANGTSVMDYARLGAAASMSPYAALPNKSVAYERAYEAAGGNDQMLSAMITEINRRYTRADALTADSRVAFDARLKDTTAEILRTGTAQSPLAETDFIQHLGLDEGVKQFKAYQATTQMGADLAAVSTMSPDEQERLLEGYRPQPGAAGYADAAKRQETLAHAIERVRRDRAADPDFKARVESTVAEASRTGKATNPIGEAEFVQRYGGAAGAAAYAQYAASLRLGADASGLDQLSPDEQRKLLEAYAPQPGEHFMAQSQRRDALVKAMKQMATERDQDPAAFAIARLPVVAEAYKNMTAALSDPQIPADLKQQAVASYAAKTLLEQARIGIAPEARRLMPQSYIDNLQGTLAAAASAGDDSVAKQIEQVATLWGDEHWPQIYQHLQAKTQPVVRVLGAGVKPFAGRMLAELATVSVNEILKEQHEVKGSALHNDVIDAMRPFAASLTGKAGSVSLFSDFAGQIEKLAAFYVTSGKSTSEAAAQAFDDVIGHKYEWGATYRVPKSVRVPLSEVAAGIAAARERLGDQPPGRPEGSFTGMVVPGNIDLDQRPRVQNADGSVSTVRSMSVNIDGREVLIPTVGDEGRVLSDDDAIEHYRRTGRHLGKFDTPANADRYAEALHAQQERRYAGPFSLAIPRDNMGGLSEQYRRDAIVASYQRDGVWVTAPDESGLMLTYGNEAVRQADGRPLIIGWHQLVAMGREVGREPWTRRNMLGMPVPASGAAFDASGMPLR